MEKVKFINSNIPLWAGDSDVDKPSLTLEKEYTVTEEYHVGFKTLYHLAGYPGYFNAKAFKSAKA